HALEIDARPYELWLDPAEIDPGSWATRPDLWRMGAEILAAGPPDTEREFIHGDFQHFNMLWERERLVGILDWTNPMLGPRDVDIGHCRLNLAVMFSAEVAERFRERYEAEAGRNVDQWWDLQEICAYGPDWPRFIPVQVANRAPLDVAGMTSRVEDLLEIALSRF
ncbi:MAG: phosphotransferase, partial [Actinomycetota bacterium]